ncbi:MAG: HAD-IIIA family hydrolase [Candidatus Dormibacteraeota bacterium]|nr:HAD-IIIA family hydrolase [Candidatus Dormibacteraeota bacterium]
MARRRLRATAPPPLAVLFDRDGTLVEDVPYNRDPGLVRPRPGARRALAALRAGGIPVAVVTNQSGVGRGLITREELIRVNRRVEEAVGVVDAWLVCPHRPLDGCPCRKPKPALLLEAARRLGAPPSRCAMVGDIGADMEAARTAGVRGVLVPTPQTRRQEVRRTAETAPDLRSALSKLLAEPAPLPLLSD